MPYIKTNKNNAADARRSARLPVDRTFASCRLRMWSSRLSWRALGSPRLRESPHGAGQSDPRPPRRVRSHRSPSIGYIASRLPELIEDAENELLGSFRKLVQRLLDHFEDLNRQVENLEAQILAWHRNSDSAPSSPRCLASAPLRRALWLLPLRCKELRRRAATGGLAGPGAHAALIWRQVELVGHEQAWRQLSLHLADTRCAIGQLARGAEGGPPCRKSL